MTVFREFDEDLKKNGLVKMTRYQSIDLFMLMLLKNKKKNLLIIYPSEEKSIMSIEKNGIEGQKNMTLDLTRFQLIVN